MENRVALEAWARRNPAARYLTSHSWLAFCYGTFLFLYEISLLRGRLSWLHPVLIGWAGALFLYDVLVREFWKRLPCWQLLVCFGLAASGSVVLAWEAGVGNGLKNLVMLMLPLCAFYPVCLMERRRPALLGALWGAAIVVFLASLAALVLYFAGVSQAVTVMGVEKTIGYRYYLPGDPGSGLLLYGLYEDTNHAAAYALIFAAYGLLLYGACRAGEFPKPWQNQLGRYFGIISAGVQLLYFPLANSRGGWVSLELSLGVILFIWFYKKGKRRPWTALALAAAGVAAVWFALMALRSLAAQLALLVGGGFGISGRARRAWSSFDKADITLGSGRLTIWKDALALFRHRPVFGTASQNQFYALQYQLAPYTLAQGKAVHNSYLDLLVSSGILGFGLLMAFWVRILYAGGRKLLSPGQGWDYAAGFLVVLIAGVSVFLSCVFVNTTAMYFVLLVLAGYLVSGEVAS